MSAWDLFRFGISGLEGHVFGRQMFEGVFYYYVGYEWKAEECKCVWW